MDALEDAAASALRALPDWRGKAHLALGYKRATEGRRPSRGAFDLRLADGSSMSLPRGSSMSWVVAATGHWDRHVIGLAERFVAPGTLVLDVGASLGLWAVPLGRIVRERGAVLWCFEPNPENLPWLTSNIAANGLRDVAEVHPLALGSRAATAMLGFREPGGGNGAITTEHAGAVMVPVKRIDDLALPVPVSFMKMDVEGFELEVMRGMRGMLERDRPVILGEFNATWLRERGEDLPEYLREIAGVGYDIFALDQRRSRRWRSNDIATLRRLTPPFTHAVQDLVFIPACPVSAS